MTAIVAIENGNLDDKVKVSSRAASIWGSTIKLKPGEELTLKELLYGMMLRSGNDAALAVAEHVGGTVENFVKMMNDKARSWDLKIRRLKHLMAWMWKATTPRLTSWPCSPGMLYRILFLPKLWQPRVRQSPTAAYIQQTKCFLCIPVRTG